MQGCQSSGQVQRFLAAYGPLAQHVRPRRPRFAAPADRRVMGHRFQIWQELVGTLAAYRVRYRWGYVPACLMSARACNTLTLPNLDTLRRTSSSQGSGNSRVSAQLCYDSSSNMEGSALGGCNPSEPAGDTCRDAAARVRRAARAAAGVLIFRRPSLCRPVHRQCMRNKLLDVTTLVLATAGYQRNDVETYRRYKRSSAYLNAIPPQSHSFCRMLQAKGLLSYGLASGSTNRVSCEQIHSVHLHFSNTPSNRGYAAM